LSLPDLIQLNEATKRLRVMYTRISRNNTCALFRVFVTHLNREINRERKTKAMVAPTPTPAPKPVQKRLAYGGVSPKQKAPAIKGQEVISAPKAPPTTAGVFSSTFVYNGGPVISCPFVYTSFWGPNWLNDPAHLTNAGRLSQFHKDLVASNFMNVLSQYGVGYGAGSGLFLQASFCTNVGTTLTDAGIQGIIQSGIDAGVFPEPGSSSQTCLMIYMDETIGIQDPGAGLVLCEATGDTAFGYHNFFITTAGHSFQYAVIPALNDTCLTESCPGNDAGCSLHLSEAQFDRLTQVASHEFAEMTTDPQLNAWYDPNNGECGDICNGETEYIVVGSNSWAVQPEYSKYDDETTNGAIYCLAESPTAEPRLSPGPASRASSAVAGRMREMSSYSSMLPLPSVEFDARAKVASFNGNSTADYVRRLFFPLTPSTVITDLPGFLHKFADSVAAAKF